MSTPEMGIGFEDRDLRSGLGCFLSHVLYEDTRRRTNRGRTLSPRRHEVRRLNKLAKVYGVDEIVLAFLVFAQRYGRRAKRPLELFLRKFDWCWRTGFRRVCDDEKKVPGQRDNSWINRETINEWIYCQLEERGLLAFTDLVADYPRWGRGAAELDAGFGVISVMEEQAEPAVVAERVA